MDADGFGLFWRNSILVTLSAVLLALVVALGAAFAVARMRWRGRRQFVLMVFIAQMAPWESLIIPIYIISRDTDMLDRLPTLTLVYFMMTLPFTIVVLRGFIATIPPELEESAQVDGCTRLGAFRHIAFPLLAPGPDGHLAVRLHHRLERVHLRQLPDHQAAGQPHPARVAVLVPERLRHRLGRHHGRLHALRRSPSLVVFLLLQRHVTSGFAAGAVKG